MSVSEICVCRIYADKISVGEIYIDKLSLGKMTSRQIDVLPSHPSVTDLSS